MPANVAAANSIIAPYLSILNGACQISPSGIPSTLTGAALTQAIQPYVALYAALPTLLPAAQTLDAWYSSQGMPSSNTANVQCAQQNLPAVFSALGMTTPTQSGSSGSGSTSGTNWFTETSIDSIPNWAFVAGGGVILLALIMGNR
jgi:hypothetical protein